MPPMRTRKANLAQRCQTETLNPNCPIARKNLQCDKDLIKAIQESLRDKEERLRRETEAEWAANRSQTADNTLFSSIPIVDEYISTVHRQTLVAGEMVFTQMKKTQRYQLPHSIQTSIIIHMRRHCYYYKRPKNNRLEIEDLYERLEVGSSAIRLGSVNSDFLQLCRNKIDSCLRTKGRLFEKQGLFKLVGVGNYRVEWLEWTKWWLEDGWIGNVEFEAFQDAQLEASLYSSAVAKPPVVEGSNEEDFQPQLYLPECTTDSLNYNDWLLGSGPDSLNLTPMSPISPPPEPLQNLVT